ncbi:hypothetical protein Q4577_22740 [Marinovum sp. 2_MG-2023]|uniref:hypothetical protein n=1 Tax=unclassified Marinovum TaxID=2647166 RepID=UPI0026E20F96|nr:MULTISPECIES: hypothetical protein [unclassified Marinovum]MDO6732837.1 hypothetical protein [Marinovum sp. 2_MG-2023]MDO6782121.1 hypothetical protein [Marinovum sp. 1_MG-2023]
MKTLDSELVRLVFQAVRNPEKWQQVLQHVIGVTPAKAAIITLRDRKTCQIVNDDALEREYHSPLIQGFPLEAVVYYLEELRTIDPWAAAQVSHHPHLPTIMSTICHPAEASDRLFFDWLEAGGLRDTVAFELDRFPGHWTAINLFLEHYDTDDSKTLLDYCNTHASVLREAWQSSQHVIRCRQAGQAALNSLSDSAVPTCIVTHSGDLYLSNDAFQDLQAQGVVRFSGPSRRVSLAHNVEITGSQAQLMPDMPRHEATDSTVAVQASPFEIDPLYKEKKERYWLLRFQLGNGRYRETTSYALGLLTVQERQIFDAICAGDSVQAAGQKIGIQRSRAFDVWANVKSKLGISNAHELRGILAGSR